MQTQTTTGDYIVEMVGITKRFPGIIANEDVTIRIRKGEIYALLGENGAGKSTLMSMLFGMYEPDEGEIFIRGKKEKITSPSYAASLNIGMVHQHFKLVSNYTIAQNIILGAEPTKKLLGFIPIVDEAKANREIAEISRQYGLEVDPTAVIEDVNVSTRQRVEILKMLYRNAEILIFDEPTAVLTPQEIDSLLGIIRALRDGGKTIILITHKLEEIRQVADRCAILRRGKLIDVRDVPGMDAREMAALMVGHEVQLTAEKSAAKFGDPVLEVSHLVVENEEHFQTVRDVSFTVHAGEIFSIAGVSGNGQTEIADAVAGRLKAKSGTIRLHGQDITNMSIRQRTLAGISYIPEDRQQVGLILDFTLRDNLGLKDYHKEPFQKSGMLNQPVFEENSEKLIDGYDIRSANRGSTMVRSMSGGNQQKAIIGREIEQDASLCIFVQPTRGLDIGAIENIHRQIIAERDKGKAVLLISLELDEVTELSDTIAVIYSGAFGRIAPAEDYTTSMLGEYMMGVAKDNAKNGGGNE
ncbi:MAG: ABC transporter ATP-binding protein [Lachnospiraceae bacterium]|nr:ABC transporter ATP-binding protein [Lachnospiraceae bacterium]